MKRLIKILLIIVGVIIVLAVLGFFAISSFLTPAYLRGLATKIASDALHRPVEIGNVSLKIGFKIGVTIDNVSMQNETGFSPGEMLQIEKVALNFKLLPLLKREIIISSIDFAGMDIKVEKNKSTQYNFAFLMPKEKKGSGWTLSLNSINIAKSSVHYADAISKIELQVKDINQHVKFDGTRIGFSGSQTIYFLKSKVFPDAIFKMSNNAEYDTLKKDLNIKKITITYAPIDFNISGMIEKLEKLSLNISVRIDDLSKALTLIPGDSRPQKMVGSAKASVSVLGTISEPKLDGKCEIKNMAIRPKGFNRDIEKVNGSLSFDGISIRNIIIQGFLATTKFDIAGSIANLKEPALDLSVKLAGNLGDFESLTNELKDIKMSGPLNMTVALKGPSKKPSCFGDFSIGGGTIDGIGLAKPINNLKARGTIQSDAAKISECSGSIGRSDFSFNGHVSNFKKPIIQLTNRSNLIDLDELLPKDKGKKTQGGKGAPLTLQGNMRIKNLAGADLDLKNINASFTLENGIVDMKNCTADAYDGKVQFDFYYNMNSPEPYRLSTRMNNLSAQKLLKRFLKFDNLEARVTGMSNFQGKGFTQAEVLANLSASGNLKLVNGIFNNFPFFNALFVWLGMKDYKELPFKDFMCYFNIDNGKTKVEDWALSSSFGDFLTNGTIKLDGTVNLTTTLTLSKKESNLLKKYHADWILFYDNNGRAVVDMLITGKLKSPSFKLDSNKIKERIKGKIKDEFNKKKKDWEKKLEDLLKGKK